MIIRFNENLQVEEIDAEESINAGNNLVNEIKVFMPSNFDFNIHKGYINFKLSDGKEYNNLVMERVKKENIQLVQEMCYYYVLPKFLTKQKGTIDLSVRISPISNTNVIANTGVIKAEINYAVFENGDEVLDPDTAEELRKDISESESALKLYVQKTIEDGYDLRVIGTVDSINDLPKNLTFNDVGISYFVGITYPRDVYTWGYLNDMELGWSNQGPLKVLSDDPVLEFAKSEWERSVNKFTGEKISTVTENNYNLYLKYVKGLKPNTTYTIQIDSVGISNLSSSSALDIMLSDQSTLIQTISNWNYDISKPLTFTTPSNINEETKYIIRVRNSFTTDSAITRAMLNKGTKALPYQPYNSASHITNPEADLLKSEWEKQLNVFHVPDVGETTKNGITYSIKDGVITLNGTCTASFDIFNIYNLKTANTGGIRLFYNTSEFPLGVQLSSWKNSWDDYLNVNADNNKFGKIYTSSRNHVAVSINKNAVANNLKLMPMITNEPTIPSEFSYWNGEIIHEKDIKPVLLWENGSPDIAYTPPTDNIPIIDISGYKYFFALYKPLYSNAGQATILQKYKIDKSYQMFDLMGAYSNSSESYICGRKIELVNYNALKIYNAYKDKDVDNYRCVPIAFYAGNY
jgi:hypothetical protein